jgi:hypothetical protein
MAHIFFSLAPQPPWALVCDIQFHDHFTDGRTFGRVISSSRGLDLTIGQHKHRINAYTYQISMLYLVFEPTIPASERAKAVHALDRSVTVTGPMAYIYSKVYTSIHNSVHIVCNSTHVVW